MHHHGMSQRIGIATALWLFAIPSGWAATIRLDDGTTINADVLRLDDEHVVIGLPRDAIATVNGKPLPPALAEGVMAPPFTVQDLAGQSQTVGGSHNGRITVLHFWVNWCPHCRSDAPKVQALYNQFRDNPKVRVVTVNLDKQRETVDRFLKEHQVTYPVISATEQAAASAQMDLPVLYQIDSFPVTFVIDGEGVIRRKFTGSFTEAGENLVELVNRMLANPSAAASRQPDHT